MNFYAILRGFCEPGTIPRPWQFGLAESPPRAESRGYNLSKTQLIYDTVPLDAVVKVERTLARFRSIESYESHHAVETIRAFSRHDEAVVVMPAIFGFYADRRPPPELSVLSYKRMATETSTEDLGRMIIREAKVVACNSSYLAEQNLWEEISKYFEMVTNHNGFVLMRRTME